MISSTFRDLEYHRAALMRAVAGHGMHPVGMEQDSALPDGTVVDASIGKVRDAAAYVGVVSRRYGQVPDCTDNPDGVSLTELEFREASRLGRPTLIFVMAADHPLTESDVELDPEKRQKLDAFRENVKAAAGSTVHRVYREFHSLTDFEVAANQAVAALRRHLDARPSPPPAVGAPDPAAQDAVPVPPALYAEPPYIGSHDFVGRVGQLARLDDWAAPAEPHPVLLFEAIGGAGKSMLTWEWTTRYAPAARDDWAGRFWYSFYEKGAVMADFCRRALAYTTRQPLERFAKKRTPELTELLLRQLQARPWLMVLDGLERVLVAYHRYDAAQLADERAGTSDEIAHRDPCAAIRPQDDDLLRRLAGAAPSKVIITSRLVPRVLLNPASQPIRGVLHERLPGLRPADAEALLRACGVDGDSETMRTYLQRHCDCHPLVTGIVAGLVNDYLPARGRFDAWAADPHHGGRLDLADLDLVQKRNHILHAALAALPSTGRQLLSTLALVPEAVDYETLRALSPFLPPEPERVFEPLDPVDTYSDFWEGMSTEQREEIAAEYRRDLEAFAVYQRALEAWRASPEVAVAERELGRTVRDLERRGLLQYDRQADRYDLHPVVRGTAAGLPDQDRDLLGQRVVDHFSERPHDPYEEAERLDDLRNGLTVVRTLLRIGRVEDAAEAYIGELSNALFYNLEAYPEVLSLLRPFFPHSWTAAPSGVSDLNASHLLTNAAISLEQIDEIDEALSIHELVLNMDCDLRQRNYVEADLAYICRLFDKLNRQARRARCIALARSLEGLLRMSNEHDGIIRIRVNAFAQLASTGRVAEAERMWQSLDTSAPNISRTVYRPGDAEVHYVRFLLDRGILTEDWLTRAEQLARSARNRPAVRRLHALRGEWLMVRGEWDGAAHSLAEAVRMAREGGLVDTAAEETRLALARFHTGQLVDPREEAGRLSELRRPAHLPLAELWHALGDVEPAVRHALAAYRHAWADGEPYVHRYLLERAGALLTALGTDIPALPAYDPAEDPKLPWEDKVAATIALWDSGASDFG